MINTYFVEHTDLYGCWVSRYKVKAKSPLGAIQKYSRLTGLSFNFDGVKYCSQGTCVFIELWDSFHNELNFEEL